MIQLYLPKKVYTYKEIENRKYIIVKPMHFSILYYTQYLKSNSYYQKCP